MEQQMEGYRALSVGTELNRQYVIEKVLGKGGFGITYLCLDKFLKISVAIKEFFPTQIANRDTTGTNTIIVSKIEYSQIYKDGLKEYEYEANKLTKFAELDGVVSVLNFFYENSTAYMVMEYVKGITLKDYLKSHGERVSWQEMLSLMKPIFKSMNMVHEEGIVHRDVSPDNIMVSPKKALTIIDFGSARSQSEGIDETIKLKHGYAPPEQYDRMGDYGAWTDVYALCATMYRMLTGEKLPKSIDVRDKKVKIKPLRQYDASIPVGVENAILRGLRPEIVDRTKSVLELEKQLYSDVKVKFAIKSERRKLIFCIASVIVSILVIMVVLKFNNSKSDYSQEVIESEADTQANSAKTYVKISKDNEVEYVLPKKYESLPEISDELIMYETIDNSITIDKLDVSVSDGKLPKEIDDMPVKVIKGMGPNVSNIMIPEGIECIGENAFKNCVYLESIYIPSTMKIIDSKAFVNCQSLKEVELSRNNKEFYIQENTLFSSNGEEIIKW